MVRHQNRHTSFTHARTRVYICRSLLCFIITTIFSNYSSTHVLLCAYACAWIFAKPLYTVGRLYIYVSHENFPTYYTDQRFMHTRQGLLVSILNTNLCLTSRLSWYVSEFSIINAYILNIFICQFPVENEFRLCIVEPVSRVAYESRNLEWHIYFEFSIILSFLTSFTLSSLLLYQL